MKLLRGLLLKPTLNLLHWILTRKEPNSLIIGGPLGWSWQPTLDATHHGSLAGPAKAHRHSDLDNIGIDDHHARDHAARHQDGGADQISLAGLTGETATAQPPKPHASSHESSGSDAIKLDDLADPDDNLDLNVSTSAHGLCPKAPDDTAKFLRGDASWATVPKIDDADFLMRLFTNVSSGAVIDPARFNVSVAGNLYCRTTTGSGWGWGSSDMAQLSTGGTKNSSAAADTPVVSIAQPGSYWGHLNWSKIVAFEVRIYQLGASATSIGRIQLKDTTDKGALAGKGIGFKIVNNALYAESYGTQLGENSLNTTLTEGVIYRLLVIHNPGNWIKWFVDSGAGFSLKYTETTPNKIPSGEAAYAQPSTVVSVENGETDQEYSIWISQFKVFSEN